MPLGPPVVRGPTRRRRGGVWSHLRRRPQRPPSHGELGREPPGLGSGPAAGPGAGLSPATFDSYRRNIELHVIPRIGGVPLQKLAAEDLDGLYASLSAAGGRRDGKKGGLSPKSVRLVHSVLHKAHSDARRKGTLARNVAEVADAPKLRSAVKRQEIKVWTPEELRRFLELAADNRNHAAWFMTSHTGMRRGEVLGLRWSDVDLDGEGSPYAKR